MSIVDQYGRPIFSDARLAKHLADTGNPHSVTAAQTGAAMAMFDVYPNSSYSVNSGAGRYFTASSGMTANINIDSCYSYSTGFTVPYNGYYLFIIQARVTSLAEGDEYCIYLDTDTSGSFVHDAYIEGAGNVDGFNCSSFSHIAYLGAGKHAKAYFYNFSTVSSTAATLDSGPYTRFYGMLINKA